MPVTITSPRATEEGTYILDFAFYDENDALVVPTAMAWTLTDVNGDAINGRTAVDINPLVSSGSIVLSGDDLALPAGSSSESKRYVTFVGTYTSSLGTDLPLTDDVEFVIDPLPGVPN